MMASVHFTLLFLWVTPDAVSCVNTRIPTEVLPVVLGGSVTITCTYNCSDGFVRACWSKTPDNSVCHGIPSRGAVCTNSLHLSNVSAEDLKKRYTCYTQATDDPRLPQKTERVVLLQLEAHTSAPNWTVTSKTENTNATVSVKPKDSSEGEFTGIKVLATVSVAVAIVLAALAAYLCLNWSRQSSDSKGEPVLSRPSSPHPSHAVLSPVKGSLSTQSERVTLRIPTPDNESETEVPYADIMIAARGVSTPELTQVCYLTPGDQNEWRGDESSRSYLQATRSADRLHLPLPREVSRKMSTNSEYAVITYA